MRAALGKFAAGLLGFPLGAVAGYCAVLFGWIGYTELFDVFDRDGGKIMGIAFFFAPVTAVAVGVIAAIWLARRVGQRRGAPQ